MSDNNITFVATISLTDGKLAREFPRPRAASANPDGRRETGENGRNKERKREMVKSSQLDTFQFFDAVISRLKKGMSTFDN